MSADASVISALVRVVVSSLLAEEEPHFQQIGTAELPLWVERKQSLGLLAAQAAKSSDVVRDN